MSVSSVSEVVLVRESKSLIRNSFGRTGASLLPLARCVIGVFGYGNVLPCVSFAIVFHVKK